MKFPHTSRPPNDFMATAAEHRITLDNRDLSGSSAAGAASLDQLDHNIFRGPGM